MYNLNNKTNTCFFIKNDQNDIVSKKKKNRNLALVINGEKKNKKKMS